jgi:predicted Zn-dependent protease with MMP-like domain
MSRCKTVYTEVEVDVDISDFDTEDLIEELEERGELPSRGLYTGTELVEKIWMLRRNGQDYQRQLDDLIYNVTGHVI